MMSELNALTPRTRVHGSHTTHSTGSHHHHHVASAPAFTINLEDCEVEEGESFDLQCTTEGRLSLLLTWLMCIFRKFNSYDLTKSFSSILITVSYLSLHSVAMFAMRKYTYSAFTTI